MNQFSPVIWSPGVTLDSIEEQVIKKAYVHFRKNKTATATSLGISVRTLDNKLERYDEEENQREVRRAERERTRQEQLIKHRGTVPTQPRIESYPQPAPQYSPDNSVSVSESEGVSEMLSSQTTSLGKKKAR